MTEIEFQNKIDECMDKFKKYLDKSKLQHKDYQYEGVKWCLINELRENPLGGLRGGLIADEMGLGKTIMMIGTFVTNRMMNTLIIVPPILIDQWFMQIYKTTGHKPLIYHGDNKKTITIDILKKACIVITTYGAVTLTKEKLAEKEVTLLHKIMWSRIVFDEAHHLRNSKTTRFASVKLLSAKIRWLVSGTPIQNRKEDCYSLCSVLRIPASYYTNPANLQQIIANFIMKRTKKQVGIIIPDVVQNKNIVTWNNRKEMEISKFIHSGLAFSRVSMKNDINDLLESSSTLLLLLRARQSCIYSKLISDHYEGLNKDIFNGSSKLDLVIQKILERKGNGCGKLIFCHFHDEIDEIAKRLRAGGIEKVATFDGRIGNGKRFDILNDKNEALILQIQTGCEGLNLQENYSEIYFVSPHWNPAVEDQAIARCHRIGQTKPVYVERFEMDKFTPDEDDEQQMNTITIDNYISEIQENKRSIANNLYEIV